MFPTKGHMYICHHLGVVGCFATIQATRKIVPTDRTALIGSCKEKDEHIEDKRTSPIRRIVVPACTSKKSKRNDKNNAKCKKIPFL